MQGGNYCCPEPCQDCSFSSCLSNPLVRRCTVSCRILPCRATSPRRKHAVCFLPTSTTGKGPQATVDPLPHPPRYKFPSLPPTSPGLTNACPDPSLVLSLHAVRWPSSTSAALRKRHRVSSMTVRRVERYLNQRFVYTSTLCLSVGFV